MSRVTESNDKTVVRPDDQGTSARGMNNTDAIAFIDSEIVDTHSVTLLRFLLLCTDAY